VRLRGDLRAHLAGFVYVSFVIDVFARMIVVGKYHALCGRTLPSMRSSNRSGGKDDGRDQLVHHSDRAAFNIC